jgi:hypothetical protein
MILFIRETAFHDTLQSQPYGAGLVVNHHLWQVTQEFNLSLWLHICFPEDDRMKNSDL